MKIWICRLLFVFMFGVCDLLLPKEGVTNGYVLLRCLLMAIIAAIIFPADKKLDYYQIKSKLKELKKIGIHKKYMLRYCRIAGIGVQDIINNSSKFSPIELWEGIGYFYKDCFLKNTYKEKHGHIKPWTYNRMEDGRYYECWQHHTEKNSMCAKMPFGVALNLACHYLGAGMMYGGNNFSYKAMYEWWKMDVSKSIAVHPQTKMFIEMLFRKMAATGETSALKKHEAKKIYNIAKELNSIYEQAREMFQDCRDI